LTYEQDWPEFYKLAEMIARVCFVQRKNKDEWEEQITFMFELLSEYSLAEVKHAMAQHVKTQKFFPTPADITKLISGSPEDKSAVAWRTFLTALDRYGYYDSVRFPDPAYHYAIQQFGGWERLCEKLHTLSDRELQFRAKDWRQLYEIGLRKAAWDDEQGKVSVPKYLWGAFERENREQRYDDFIPEVIDVQTGEKLDKPAIEAVTASRGQPVQILRLMNDLPNAEPHP
jgi:hypothetical protein